MVHHLLADPVAVLQQLQLVLVAAQHLEPLVVLVAVQLAPSTKKHSIVARWRSSAASGLNQALLRSVNKNT